MATGTQPLDQMFPVAAPWPLPKPMHYPFTGTSALIGIEPWLDHDGWHVEYRIETARSPAAVRIIVIDAATVRSYRRNTTSNLILVLHDHKHESP